MAAFMGVGMAVVSAQSAPELSALTIPAANLPEGCGLTPLPPEPSPRPPIVLPDGTVIVRSSTSHGTGRFPSNPWFGTEYEYIAQIRASFEGVPQMPDGPPLDRADASRLKARLAGDITDAYHASYDTTSDGPVLIQAVRYADAKWAPPTSWMRTLIGARRNSIESVRIVRGHAVILITGHAQGQCFKAVRNYIESLK